MYNPVKNIVVIGGNDAGLAAAGRAKRLNPNLNITVLEKSDYAGYASCGFPFYLSGDVSGQDVSGPSVEEIKTNRGFNIETGTEAVKIDVPKRKVFAVSNGQEKVYPYSKLVLAMGAKPVVPTPLDVKASNIFVLRNFNQAKELDNYISKTNPKNAVIIGAGFLGLEMAEALSKRSISVTIVENSGKVLPKYFEEISSVVTSNLKDYNVGLMLNEEVVECRLSGEKISSIHLKNNRINNPDIVLVTAGVKPNVGLAVAANIPLGSTGAIAVNSHMETKRMNIFAVGDVAESRNVVCGKNMWLPFAGIASKQGRVAGTTLAGKKATMPYAAGTAMVKAFGLEFGSTGLNWEQAHKADLFNPVYSVIQQKSKPGYMTDACDITLAIIADKQTEKLLGAQIVGKADAGHRLNILATALTGQLTVNDLEYLDFGYTPPISNLWDPIAIAGNVIQKKLRKNK